MKMNRLELIEELKSIKNNDFKVPEGGNPFEMALAMTEYLGDTDAELRDDLIYSTLGRWITHGIFSGEQLKQLLKIILDEKHLFYGIGEKDKDSVFMRAFSILIVASIVYVHREAGFLSNEELKDVKNKVIQYMQEEKDLRGYVVEGGWAHTTAHSSDTLDELALCKEFGIVELLEILKAIKNKISVDSYAYICYEDERMAYATNSLITRNLLTEEEISEWIKSFSDFDKNIAFPNQLYLNTNIRNYLNSLYYRLPKDQYKTIKEAISDTILLIRRY
ncbi:MAG: hypothetical protein K0R80_786 [Clostridia bacterium]|jgi:hypothetical protein|nr:hypothetical protein [Clostridia bacterium]